MVLALISITVRVMTGTTINAIITIITKRVIIIITDIADHSILINKVDLDFLQRQVWHLPFFICVNIRGHGIF